MTYELMNTILTELALPFAYDHFREPPTGNAYVAYFESDKIRFLADDVVYHHEPHFAVELYTAFKDPTLEGTLMELFERHEVPWSGGDSVWIESEKMYQTVFYV